MFFQKPEKRTYEGSGRIIVSIIKKPHTIVVKKVQTLEPFVLDCNSHLVQIFFLISLLFLLIPRVIVFAVQFPNILGLFLMSFC